MDVSTGIITDWVFEEQPPNIKVIGVGGGGGNAVTHMYNEGIRNVSFVLCNTDRQDLIESEVPTKVQIGEGTGSGNDPEKGRIAAEESLDEIRAMLGEDTKMVFITAGMGGGTGTGAAPVIARVAKEMNILTVGIVTTPFMFEKKRRIQQAKKSVEEMSEYVDALLVINNERLRHIYSGLSMINAFKKADDILAIAARSIVELERIPGYINVDFADVYTVLKGGGTAIIGSGLGNGDNRIAMAIENALTSPLLNSHDVYKAKKILLNIYCSGNSELMMDEFKVIDNFMEKFKAEDVEFIWGTAFEENLGENVKITILATGFSTEDVLEMPVMSEKPEKGTLFGQLMAYLKKQYENLATVLLGDEEKTQKTYNYG